MSNDIEEDLVKIFRWQTWIDEQDWGYAYRLSSFEIDEIPDILMQLEITKKRLIQMYTRAKLVEEEERYESYNES